ncbi:metal-dependent hydrolase [Paenibacillus sp. TAB 01]|uniref:metal-dependent hydrolase n=1 Tax=Paenibacillus sp. TAB 01 TaxID=3368988 RepID=UPI003751A009
MDTGSHLLFGATLAGAAMLDPAVNGHPELFYAVLAATVIGSHAPDLDALARLRGYTAYIRLHRGFTHSIPALFLWPPVISWPAAVIFNAGPYFMHVWIWCMLAVMLHVFLDWCNVYGVQCFRPFSSKWQHLDVLALFEPFLFGLHALGIGIWSLTELDPGRLFASIYAITFVYIGFRAWMHSRAVRRVRRELGQDGVCHVLPGFHWFQWQFVVETGPAFYTGMLRGGKVYVEDTYTKEANPSVVEATKTVDGVQVFLHFAQRVYVRSLERQDGYVVEWRDVRFWYRHRLPFGVDVELDRDLKVVRASLGWRKKVWDLPFV